VEQVAMLLGLDLLLGGFVRDTLEFGLDLTTQRSARGAGDSSEALEEMPYDFIALGGLPGRTHKSIGEGLGCCFRFQSPFSINVKTCATFFGFRNFSLRCF
jgi:hypothetical protein